MSLDQSVWLLLVTAIVLANVPWLFANRIFLFIKVPHKSIVINLLEWLLYFILTGILAYLLENKSMGHVQEQGWEFYTVTFFMFVIFAFPGFIYRYNLKKFLDTKKV
ncbi:DUF2818 family protein [Thiomicrorhabdus sp. ZW0627]|uniref:DUF2818 family protein n=1 Tax=Thiomicrorhabdus sp. ZW0627 TaxID=3039774 RepID=UPI002436520E|nr:DUF2818 family protein [Thiomicrorhabdus sp. ZW0627]MDG6774669.1 DUF2818 family protein [Thiomicrorhabdus sp. ZW0627]